MNVPPPRLVFLAGDLSLLQVLVHVSTCYVHPDKPRLVEQVLEPAVDYDQLVECVDSGDDIRIQRMTEQ